MTYFRSRRSGFTLIEMLVVIAILGILASMLILGVAGLRDRAKRKATEATLGKLKIALESYYAEFKEYPPDGYSTAVSVTPEGSESPIELKGTQCLLYFLGEKLTKTHYVGTEEREKTIGPFLSFAKGEISGETDIDKRLGVWDGETPRHNLVVLIDAWGNPIMYDNVEEEFHDLSDFSTAVPESVEDLPPASICHGPDPRTDGEPRNEGVDLWSHGSDVEDIEDNVTNWK